MQYYKVIYKNCIEYIHAESSGIELYTRGQDCFIVPLGTHKPKNVSRETIITIRKE